MDGISWNKIIENGMGRSRSDLWAGGEKHTGFGWGNVRVRGAHRTCRVEISKLMVRKLDLNMGWIDVAEDRDMWREFVNAVMSILVT